MRPAEWSREGSDIDGKLEAVFACAYIYVESMSEDSPRFPGPLTPCKSRLSYSGLDHSN